PDLSASVGTHVEEIEWNGEKTLSATTVIVDNKWVLVIKEDPREALTPLLRARYIAIALFIAGALIIVAGTIFISRAMISTLFQTDREKAMLDASLVQSGKMAALGKLAAGIAHEVNSPLSVIKEKAGWMKDLLVEEEIQKSENLQEFEDAIAKIEYHVDRAKKVTHRLLSFARRMEPVYETVDISKTLDETIAFLEHEARHRNIVIRTDYLESLPRTKSDSAQLQQVFLNILDNAIDAIGKDGEINIKTNHNSKDREIAIAITDSGPGIPKEILKKMFDPFVTTKKAGDGAGLGLSISHGIIKKLGGRITVETKEEHGATFTVYLPVERS
ncbi:MAG: GHKL domain-containing protein, partial [Desulfobacterales bacterium]|nr:GHKL domain-containing protein [Desulfobacterales bacterium]